MALKTLYLYDSLQAQKREFVPIKAGEIGMYVCGMTVYDDCHIGHARVMVAFDACVRAWRALGYKVRYVRNITDIDDKIIARAQENSEPIHVLTERVIQSMHQDSDSLGCLRPDIEPKATEYIAQMHDLIHTLTQKGYAYAKGDVYFNVQKFADYGRLSGRKLDEQIAGARIDIDSDKAHPFDFVLWKRAKSDEIAWDSPWGAGRPGWHIECSAMSIANLGENFDIHGGGFDLKFPHHENEIAQSECATNQKYANYWLHIGFVNVDGEKMSKSLGNFFTIKEVLQKFDGEVVRYFMLQSHYKSPINFSDTALKDAQKALTKLYQALALYAAHDLPCKESVIDDNRMDAFFTALADDMNTPKALALLFDTASALNSARTNGDSVAHDLAYTLRQMGKVLNILQNDNFLQSDDNDFADKVAQKIDARTLAKAQKDYAKADTIRDELLDMGVELLDSKEGTTWRKI